MAQVINTNSLSLMTQNNLNASQSSLNTAIQRLSSGLRINSAKDDAAGQAIANRFTANIKGLTQAQRNANDGISLAQTTEGALTEVTNNLQRVRELSVQAANGTNSADDLTSIQDEIKQRLDEIDRISAQTDFNGVKVLSSSAKALTVQVGANDGETISIDLKEISSKTLNLSGFTVAGNQQEANAAAKTSDLTAAGAVLVGGKYEIQKANDAAKMADVFGKLQNGSTVALADSVTPANNKTYTYDATNKNFAYAASDSTANVAAAIQAQATANGGTITGTITIGTEAVDVSIDGATGNLTTLDGQALYINGGELTVTNTGGATQATLSDVLTEADAGGDFDAAGAAASQFGGLTINNADSTSTAYAYNATGGGAGIPGFDYTAKISSSDLQAQIAANATPTTTYSAALGGLGGTYDLGMDGSTVKVGAADAFVDAAGNFTLDDHVVTETYSVDADGNVTDSAGKATYLDPDGKLTAEATHAGEATADPLKALDAALSTVDKLRSSLGAVQNRFDSTIANLGTTITNLSSSRSRIQDADYATEVSNMTRAQILQQAGTSVLAQANQTTQNVLSLLR
ncbi:flagellin N-terminal helical domain-containing protein [Cupriavidus oxalaticus]|uniref:Flagellin n=1 Tax=Cupriavidus oxalaticus TaxID=96344 RepID=A0A5P3VF98_9BURK|nr:flagellin [Cupriavidus oxalaticus]QEZ43901.1 flagellin FliC [Cupriavidus oxalaticus]